MQTESTAGRSRPQAEASDRIPATVVDPGRHLMCYASTALAQEIDRVASAVEGQRRETLNRAAFRLGQLVAACLLPEPEVVRELTSAALIAGLDLARTTHTIRSGLVAGRGQPRLCIPAGGQRGDQRCRGAEVGA